MANKTLLSVAIIVQNQRDVIESTLTSLFELEYIPFELVLIDDASEDGSTQIIESLLDYYQNDQAFYFQHDQVTGRGPSLNEALQLSSGNLFWAPETVQEINEEQLSRLLERLSGSSQIAAIQNFIPPDKMEGWISRIESKSCPSDGSFIWNMAALPSNHRFFNPYLKHYHGTELAARLGTFPHKENQNSWHKSSSLGEIPPLDPEIQQELFLSLLRRESKSTASKKVLLEKIQSLEPKESSKKPDGFDNELLEEALLLTEDGRFNPALELVESVLADEPGNSAAKQLKIRILKKKRQFVEASELEHELGEQNKVKAPEKEFSPEEEKTSSAEIEISVIIPTTTYGKPALEHCLLSIDEHCDTDQFELIVIDNASLDNTHDYLDELEEKKFMNCRIITNEQNVGFATSVNQGLKAAKGSYACILHNDVELKNDAISKLHELMTAHPSFAVLGPMTNKTLNPDQAMREEEKPDKDVVQVEYLDSFCMMISKETGLEFDEQYELAFFEDIDLCFQARSNGYKVGIAPQIEVEHYFGTTTFALDLDTESEQYWKNVAYFNEKWDIEVFSRTELKAYNTFDQLLMLDDIVNPLYPEESIKELFHELFTDELKTEIFNTQHDPETLCKLVHLFMVMDEREVMRRLEDRLEEIELPAGLIFQLVRFYYKRNIYSRCKHYLNQLKPEMGSMRADLYRLAMHVDNKEFDEAIPLLRNLLEKEPSNPLLYKLAGDIHKFEGNSAEAESFHALARQVNPYEFEEKEKDAFGFPREA